MTIYTSIPGFYFTACLFAVLGRLRSEAPFLRLASAEDTRLVTMALKVSLGFLQDGVIYYATQPSLGEDMRRADGSLVSYREFCQLLQEPSSRVWMDRLIAFYLETGLGRKLDRGHDDHHSDPGAVRLPRPGRRRRSVHPRAA